MHHIGSTACEIARSSRAAEGSDRGSRGCCALASGARERVRRARRVKCATYIEGLRRGFTRPRRGVALYTFTYTPGYRLSVPLGEAFYNPFIYATCYTAHITLSLNLTQETGHTAHTRRRSGCVVVRCTVSDGTRSRTGQTLRGSPPLRLGPQCRSTDYAV